MNLSDLIIVDSKKTYRTRCDEFLYVTQEEYDNQILYEGLIRSVSRKNILKHLEFLEKKNSKILKLTQERYSVFIQFVFIDDVKSNQILKDLDNVLKPTGWFVSNLEFLDKNHKINQFEFDSSLLSYKGQIVTISVEPKYDVEVEMNGDIFHVSPIRIRHKILEHGLTPRSGEKVASHPERIYFAVNIQSALHIKKVFLERESHEIPNHFAKSGFDIFKIDTNLLTKSTRFFIDPNFVNKDEVYGYYTLSNIPVKALKQIA